MNSFTRWTAFSVLLATSLASCNKDKEMQDITPTPPPAAVAALPVVVDGHLKFSSLASFHAFLKANENKTQEELMQMNRDMGFVSHLRCKLPLKVSQSKLEVSQLGETRWGLRS